MVKGGPKKKGQPSKKGKVTASRPAKGARGANGNSVRAPSAISAFKQPSITFASGSQAGRLKMMVRAPLFSIGAGVGATDGLIPADGIADAFTAGILALNQCFVLFSGGSSGSEGYLTPVFDLFGSAFSRYRTTRLRFEYEPQAPTTVSNRLVFGFSADPFNPLVYGASPSQSKLLSLEDCVAFVGWAPWSLDVSAALDKEWKYVFMPGTSAAPGTVTNQDVRFASPGAIACIAAANGTAVTGDTFGVLFVDWEIEFKELCPVSVTRPSLTRFEEKFPDRTRNHALCPAICRGEVVDGVCQHYSVACDHVLGCKDFSKHTGVWPYVPPQMVNDLFNPSSASRTVADCGSERPSGDRETELRPAMGGPQSVPDDTAEWIPVGFGGCVRCGGQTPHAVQALDSAWSIRCMKCGQPDRDTRDPRIPVLVD
jgi:hypothetical protein